MEFAKIEVYKTSARVVCAKPIPAGIIGATISVQYMDPIWDNLQKTVVFSGCETKDVLDNGDVITIPPEVVAKPGRRLWVGFYGTDAEKNIAIPTFWAYLEEIRSATDPSGDTSTDPSLPVWAELLAKIEALEEQNTDKLPETAKGISAVLYGKAQELTDEQKAQARENIGAVSAGDVAPLFDPTVYGLPVLYLTGDTTGISKETAVSLGYTYGELSGECTLKWQGSSSLFYPKKNYTIKFDKAFEAIDGWGEQKKYCLKANYIDHSHARNVVSAKLWGQIVKKRAYMSAAENLFDISKITGTPSTWEGSTTFDENGVLTPGSSLTESGYNPFNGLVFPAGTYNIRLEVCVTDINMFGNFYFGFSQPSTISSECFVAKTVSKDAFPQITEANTWGTYEYSLTIDRNAGFFLQPEINPSYYRFRNIEITNAEGGSGTPDAQRLLELPNGGAIDGFPVVIMLNDDFHGLYTFNIPKDGWMMGMGNGDQEAILCANYSDACWFKGAATLDGDFDLEYVSDEDNTQWVTASVDRLITACMNSDGTDLDTTIAQYLDWQSAIDYYIFKNLLNGIDMGGKNYILATYDGVMWFFSAYDMDCVYGLDWDGKKFYKAQNDQPVSNYHTVDNLIYTYKREAVKARYAELRNSVLSDDNVATMFMNFIGKIPTPLFTEDVKKWPTIPNSATNNVAQIIDYYIRRAKWIDEYMETF